MDFIYNTWWLWLLLSMASFVWSSRMPRTRDIAEIVLGVSSILLVMSVILHFFPILS